MMSSGAMPSSQLDVLCVGHASYDLIFSVPHHPGADEKIFGDSFSACGGGPAANAAVSVARLGLQAAFAGYLGNDLYGDRHLAEFLAEGVRTHLIRRDRHPSPLSAIMVKPDGARALINYKGDTRSLQPDAIDFSGIRPKVILFDGHEPLLSPPLNDQARQVSIPTVLDAGSLHAGTEALMRKVDYLVCSEKFAGQYLGRSDNRAALVALGEVSPCVVITLGEHGVLWRKGNESGQLPAFPVTAVDTTGAGDVFHGVFAAALAAGKGWDEILLWASAAGSLCCTRIGARTGIPGLAELEAFVSAQGQGAVQRF